MRMFNSKKGVSEVVANVLIVLLVIVGIAVIWSVVKPTIDKSAKSIQADCFTVSVEPVKCVTGTDSTNWDVTIKRNPGAGTLESIDLLFSDGTNTRLLKVATFADINELETKTANDQNPGLSGSISVNTVLRVGGQLCQVTSQPVNCA